MATAELPEDTQKEERWTSGWAESEEGAERPGPGPFLFPTGRTQSRVVLTAKGGACSGTCRETRGSQSWLRNTAIPFLHRRGWQDRGAH